MNPLVFIIPGLLIVSGVLCCLFLPLPLNIRLTILGLDTVGAVVVGLILFRRFSR